MKKGFLVLLAGLFLLGAIGNVHAAIETIKVSGDINLQAVSRGSLNLGGGYRFDGTTWQALLGNGNDDNYLMSQLRLRFDADLTENVFATVGLIYEGDWGKESELDTATDAQSRYSGKDSAIRLDLANITLKDFVHDGITATFGRQPLFFGNGMIMGDPDTNQIDDRTDKSTYQNKGFTGAPDLSLRKGFDAARVTVDMAPFKYDVFYSLLAEGNYNANDDLTVYGIYGSYDVGSKNTVVEPYVIFKDGTVNDYRGYSAGLISREQRIINYGMRVGTDPIENMSLSVEAAYQTGETSDLKSTILANSNAYWTAGGNKNAMHAWSTQAIAKYKLKTKYDPTIKAIYAYYSEEWDPMFETQTPSEIANLIFPQTNNHTAALYLSMMPREDITLTLGYAHYWFAQEIANFYSRGTGVLYDMDSERHNLGGEINASLVYDYTEDVQFTVASGLFMPGSAFAGFNDERAYTARGGVKVVF